MESTGYHLVICVKGIAKEGIVCIMDKACNLGRIRLVGDSLYNKEWLKKGKLVI